MIDLNRLNKLMSKRLVLIATLCLFASSCIQSPEFKTAEHALINSNYPIVSINGNEIEKTYHLDLKAGENSIVVVYDTYQYDYFCTFRWDAQAGIAYEVTDQENQQPLTLYRWYERNGLWAIRLDPVEPQECVKE